MPITKVPIVHKFGIISRSHQEEIQERILKQQTKQRYDQSSCFPRLTPDSSYENRLVITYCLSS